MKLNIDCYRLNQEESLEFIIDIENEVFSITKKEFLKKTKEIAEFAVDIFKKKFNYDEAKGIPRRWDRLEESTIDDLYNKYEKEVKYLLKNLTVLRNI